MLRSASAPCQSEGSSAGHGAGPQPLLQRPRLLLSSWPPPWACLAAPTPWRWPPWTWRGSRVRWAGRRKQAGTAAAAGVSPAAAQALLQGRSAAKLRVCCAMPAADYNSQEEDEEMEGEQAEAGALVSARERCRCWRPPPQPPHAPMQRCPLSAAAQAIVLRRRRSRSRAARMRLQVRGAPLLACRQLACRRRFFRRHLASRHAGRGRRLELPRHPQLAACAALLQVMTAPWTARSWTRRRRARRRRRSRTASTPPSRWWAAPLAAGHGWAWGRMAGHGCSLRP